MESNWVLAVDSSRKGISLALFTLDGARHIAHEAPSVRGEMLSSELDIFLMNNGVSLSSIGSVVVALGPGSFTGLRTGIAFCQGLCASGKRRLFGISSLAIQRMQLTTHVHGRVGVIAKARPGFWYTGLDAEGYPSVAFGAMLPEEEFLATDDAAAFLHEASIIIADGPRPVEGSLASLAGHWHDVSLSYSLAACRSLMSFVAPSLQWNANYIQPSYAEQSTRAK